MAIWARTAPLMLALAVVGIVGWSITRDGQGPSTAAPSAAVGQGTREHVVLQADLSAVPSSERDSRLEQVVQVTERRLEAVGVPDATVRLLEGARIAIELPPDHDAVDFMGLLTRTGRLDFREQVSQPDGTTGWIVARVRDAQGIERPLTGDYVQSATPATDPGSNRAVVAFEMSAEGQQLLAELTQRLLGQQLAIFVDDQLQVALTVRSPIVQGRGWISGNFTAQDARDLAIQLVTGPLPVPIQPVDLPRS